MGPSFQKIDGAVRAWRQGDSVLGEHWFHFHLDTDAPLTEEAAAAAAEGAAVAEAEVVGLMLASQTCDIVRSCRDRPYIEVCPLVAVDADMLEEIRKGRRPAHAWVPGVADHGLVADLDRVMTVEKAVVASWQRVPGCRDDLEARQLALALARKRVRTAFPDDFVELVAPLTKRLSSKHDKNSEEGRALRALREIRVRAAPSWTAVAVDVVFWFIRDEDQPRFAGKGWDDYLGRWLELVRPRGRFVSVDGLV